MIVLNYSGGPKQVETYSRLWNLPVQHLIKKGVVMDDVIMRAVLTPKYGDGLFTCLNCG